MHKNKSTSNISKIVKLTDSIKMINVTLKDIAEVLNAQPNENFISTDTDNRINYKLKKTDIDNLISKLKNDLGLVFYQTKKTNSIYIINDN